MQSQSHSLYDFDVKLNAETQPSNSRVKLYLGHGPDHVRNRKYVVFASKMRHDIRSLRHVILALSTTAEIPAEVS